MVVMAFATTALATGNDDILVRGFHNFSVGILCSQQPTRLFCVYLCGCACLAVCARAAGFCCRFSFPLSGFANHVMQGRDIGVAY